MPATARAGLCGEQCAAREWVTAPASELPLEDVRRITDGSRGLAHGIAICPLGRTDPSISVDARYDFSSHEDQERFVSKVVGGSVEWIVVDRVPIRAGEHWGWRGRGVLQLAGRRKGAGVDPGPRDAPRHEATRASVPRRSRFFKRGGPLRGHIAAMHEFTVKSAADLAAYEGPHEIPGVRFRAAREALGVSSFGINVLELDPHNEGYPEHDHASDEHEEVYVVLRGSAFLRTPSGERLIHQGQIVHVPGALKRKWITRDEPVTLLALGGTPGKAYAPSMGG